LLRTAAVWILIVLAIVTAPIPALVSQAVRTIAQMVSGA
jgi:hypothetical protein